MTLNSVAKQVEKFATDNSPAILTGVGVAGVVATGYLSGKSTIKAVRLIDQETRRRQDEAMDATPVGGPTVEPDTVGLKEAAKLTWKLYIPPIGVAGLTITTIVVANRIGTRRTAAMAALAAVTEKSWREYETAVKQSVTEKKVDEIRGAVAQNKVDQAVESGVIETLVIDGDTDSICVEGISGRPFLASLNDLQRIVNELNFEINHNMYVTLSQWYDKIGIPTTDISGDIGWDGFNMIELVTSGAIVQEGKYAGRPAIHIGYKNMPNRDFGSLH